MNCLTHQLSGFPVLAWLSFAFLSLANQSIAAHAHLNTFKDTGVVVRPTPDFSEQGLVYWYEFEITNFTNQLVQLDDRIHVSLIKNDVTCALELLLEKQEVQQRRFYLEKDLTDRIVQLRYKRSIEMLKLLYEKILSMEHHFAGMKAHQDISNLSNPQHYPEYRSHLAAHEEKARKKQLSSLSPIIQSNPYLAAAFSLISLFNHNSNGNKLSNDELNCVLDFTVRMHQDLQTIYYELTYLKDANQALLQDCEQMFTDCARTIGYNLPLSYCREQDDWEQLFIKLGQFTPHQSGGDHTRLPIDYYFIQQQKNQMALQFSIDRVTTFTERYILFVQQGTEYYKKFSRILAGYIPDTACSQVIPTAFTELKNDIQNTLDKFKTAYQIPEIQGSKLKEMRYGLPEN